MARKKIDQNFEAPDVFLEEDVELLEENEEALELEEESDNEDAGEPAPKRASRKKKKEPVGFAAELLKASSKNVPEDKPERAKPAPKKEVFAKVEEAEEEAEGTEIDEEEAVPDKKARRPRSTPEERNLSVAMVSAFEAMSSHWTTAKEATDALVLNFEKVKKELEEIRQSSAAPLEKLLDQNREKAAVASRVTFALSLGAIIFSFVSLTLSQSLRGQFFLHQAQNKDAPGYSYQATNQPRQAAPQSPPLSAPLAKPAATASIANAVGAMEGKSLAHIPRHAKTFKK